MGSKSAMNIKELIDKKLLLVAILGFSSGFPIVFTGGTLTALLFDVGIDIKTIGALTMVALPYNLKFLWAPLMDRFSLPFISGRRRSWILLTQLLLMVLLNLLPLAAAQQNILLVALIALAIATLSATQDIAIDALRIELLSENQQALGASASMIGYRLAMLIGSAGSLILSDHYGWQLSIFLTSLFLLPCILASYNIRDAKIAISLEENTKQNSYLAPLLQFLRSNPHWLAIIAFIILFKMPDAFSVALSTVFYKSLGYSNSEIGAVAKATGIVATIAGSLIGGFLFPKLKLHRALLIAIAVQALSNLVFIALNHSPHNLSILSLAIMVDNIAGGFGSAIFVAYISILCNKEFTASQYAALSALASLSRTTFAASSGLIVESIGWDYFFIFTMLLALPCLAVSKRALKL